MSLPAPLKESWESPTVFRPHCKNHWSNRFFFSNCFFSWVVLGSVCWLSSYWFVRHCSILVLFFRPESGFHIRAALSSNFHMPLSFRASWSCPIKREALVRIVWLSLSIPWPFHYSFPSCNGRKNSKPTTQTR